MILSVGVAVQVIDGFSVTAAELGATEKYAKQLKHGCRLLVGLIYIYVFMFGGFVGNNVQQPKFLSFT